MTIQSLLNEGDVHRTRLERVADATLLLPRVLWKGRNVQILRGHSIKDEEYTNWSTKYFNLVKGIRNNYSLAALLIPSSIFFAVFNLIATPLLTIGLGLKKISLVYDSRAYAYNAVVANQLKLDEIAQKKKVLEERLEKAEASINNAPDEHAAIIEHLLREIQKNPINQKREPKEASTVFHGLMKAHGVAFIEDLIIKIKAKYKLKDEIEKLEQSTPKIHRQLEKSLELFKSITR